MSKNTEAMMRQYKINNPKQIGRYLVGRTSQMTYILRDSKGEQPDVESRDKDHLIRLANNRNANHRIDPATIKTAN